MRAMRRFRLQDYLPRQAIGLGLGVSIALGAAGSVAAGPPEDKVDAALSHARRQADIESSLRNLETTPEERGANNDARATAGNVAKAAKGFRPVDVRSLPSSWDAIGLDPAKAEVVDDKLVQTFEDGSKVVFTIEPDVQRRLEKMLDDYNVPHGGIVLIDPPTGRVLAMVSSTEAEPAIPDLARKSTAPSASVFKVITAAALIESAGVDPHEKTCYHGGRSRLTARNIKGDARRDHKCADLGDALAWSINSIFAKLAYNKLEKEDLAAWAEKFGYNTEIPFELPVEPSMAEFVDDDLERARSAAGFWHTYLSPLHGAMIGAAVANDGVMMQPSIIQSFHAPDGEVIHEFEAKVFRRVMQPKTAKVLGELMVRTTEKGTARRYFKRRRGFPSHITVSGKTGTLSNKDPYLGFTWFVGFGQDERTNKRVAVSGLVCNSPKWRIKGPYAASEAVRMIFAELPDTSSNGVASR
jgi:cell division protein FtsI/penicillin-binding protein 2